MDKEQLSALLDGELDELAAARLLRSMAEDDGDGEALASWDEYALIGDALRDREMPLGAGCQGARRALTQILAEPAPAPGRSQRVSLRRGFAPWALAASVALVAFQFGGRLIGSGSEAGLASADGSWNRMLVSVTGAPADTSGSMAAPEMERYIELHRAVAAPGFERTAFVAGEDEGERGR